MGEKNRMRRWRKRRSMTHPAQISTPEKCTWWERGGLSLRQENPEVRGEHGMETRKKDEALDRKIRTRKKTTKRRHGVIVEKKSRS